MSSGKEKKSFGMPDAVALSAIGQAGHKALKAANEPITKGEHPVDAGATAALTSGGSNLAATAYALYLANKHLPIAANPIAGTLAATMAFPIGWLAGETAPAVVNAAIQHHSGKEKSSSGNIATDYFLAKTAFWPFDGEVKKGPKNIAKKPLSASALNIVRDAKRKQFAEARMGDSIFVDPDKIKDKTIFSEPVTKTDPKRWQSVIDKANARSAAMENSLAPGTEGMFNGLPGNEVLPVLYGGYKGYNSEDSGGLGGAVRGALGGLAGTAIGHAAASALLGHGSGFIAPAALVAGLYGANKLGEYMPGQKDGEDGENDDSGSYGTKPIKPKKFRMKKSPEMNHSKKEKEVEEAEEDTPEKMAAESGTLMHRFMDQWHRADKSTISSKTELFKSAARMLGKTVDND